MGHQSPLLSILFLLPPPCSLQPSKTFVSLSLMQAWPVALLFPLPGYPFYLDILMAVSLLLFIWISTEISSIQRNFPSHPT